MTREVLLDSKGNGRTIVEALQHHARERGSHSEYALHAHDRTETLSYSELDRRARAWGSHLQPQFAAGDRVVRVYLDGGEFVAAYLGCLYAGLVAVPLGRPGGRSAAVCADSGARAIIAIDDAGPSLRKDLEARGLVRSVDLVTPGQGRGESSSYEPRAPSEDQLAHLDDGSGGYEICAGWW